MTSASDWSATPPEDAEHGCWARHPGDRATPPSIALRRLYTDYEYHGWEFGERIPAHAELRALRECAEALREIRKKEGPFSKDQLTHAENVIEAMASLADAALSALDAARGGAE